MRFYFCFQRSRVRNSATRASILSDGEFVDGPCTEARRSEFQLRIGADPVSSGR